MRTRLLEVSGISLCRTKEQTWEAFTNGVGVNERPLIAFAISEVIPRLARLVLLASLLIAWLSRVNELQHHQVHGY